MCLCAVKKLLIHPNPTNPRLNSNHNFGIMDARTSGLVRCYIV